MEIYLDKSATTKCAEEVIDIVLKVMREDYGNPSSRHEKGAVAAQYVKEAQEVIASYQHLSLDMKPFAEYPLK